MRAYVLDRPGSGIDGLVLQDSPEPRPGPSEVLIRVEARSLNLRDLRILKGLYPIPAKKGVVALCDGSGVVVECGDQVTRVAVGARVAPTYFPRWVDGRFSMSVTAEQFGCTRDGTLAPLLVALENEIVRLPDHLSFEEAATLPCAALTAWSALFGPRPVLPGESVLTIGTGGVALFALQFAKMCGAKVFSLTSSSAKAKALERLGADHVVNHVETPEWEREVRLQNSGRGVDHVIETGSAETLPRSIACTAEEGILSYVAAVEAATIDLRVLANAIVMRRVYVGSRTKFEAMCRAIEVGKTRPVLDRVFAFSDAQEAYAYFEKRRHFGKVVIGGS